MSLCQVAIGCRPPHVPRRNNTFRLDRDLGTPPWRAASGGAQPVPNRMVTINHAVFSVLFEPSSDCEARFPGTDATRITSELASNSQPRRIGALRAARRYELRVAETREPCRG